MTSHVTGRRFAIALVALVSASLVLPVETTTAGSGTFSPGAAGIGDSYFPLYGNGGYDVQHYDLWIRYDPRSDKLDGRARITAVATKNLSRFNLDFVGLTLHSLVVDGEDALWTRTLKHELVVTPHDGIPIGTTFTVVARYAGIPETFTVPGTSIRTGVVPTDDGALIWGEPEVAAAWFPVNDHPRDKATYTIALTVPDGLKAISNGRLTGWTPASSGWRTWTWHESAPMASYLATAAIGRFDVRRRHMRNGIPILDAVDPRVGNAADGALLREGSIIRFLSQRFGRYPFNALGGIVEQFDLGGAALETQTRPVYDSRVLSFRGRVSVVVHELAHQWYGDSVALNEWKHVWLNEGFATYAEWLWSGAKGDGTPRQISNFFCSVISKGDPFWTVAPGNPGRADLFHGAVYLRGAMTLDALRRRVGGSDFFAILRAWVSQRGGGTGTTQQFETLAEHISGRELDALFRRWLFTEGSPCGATQTAARVPITPEWYSSRWVSSGS
jgi:aminopeptidase N